MNFKSIFRDLYGPQNCEFWTHFFLDFLGIGLHIVNFYRNFEATPKVFFSNRTLFKDFLMLFPWPQIVVFLKKLKLSASSKIKKNSRFLAKQLWRSQMVDFLIFRNYEFLNSFWSLKDLESTIFWDFFRIPQNTQKLWILDNFRWFVKRGLNPWIWKEV